jgi:pyrroline-5-carboxylate reductase
VIRRIGLLGAGHLAGYLAEGFRAASPDLELLLTDVLPERAEALAGRWGATALAPQALVDRAELVILAVRRPDALAACRALAFHSGQTVASTVAGLSLEALVPAVAPARAVRVMPISSAALRRSPTLLHPDDPAARAAFGLLGSLHLLPDEAAFTAASAVAALYGWFYALADEAVAWTETHGVPAEIARPLVLETLRSTADMGLARPEESLRELLERLATPGGITLEGLEVLRREGGLRPWPAALEAVLARLNTLS